MPTGAGGPNLNNLPLTSYVVDPDLFNQLTSRVVFDPINFSLPSAGNYVRNQLLQVGIVGAINLIVSGTITASVDVTNLQPGYPWDLISVQLSGNGQNNFIQCSGSTLRLRQLAANRSLVDGYSYYPTLTEINANSAVNFQLLYQIPVAMDNTTLVGALYAQSEATNLTYQVTTAAMSDLFNGGTVAISATVYMEEEIYEVPYHPSKQNVLVIPDLTVLHGLVENDNAVASQTTVDTQLFRINGQMARLFFKTIDASTSTAKIITPTGSYSQAQLIYGSNQTPYTFNPMAMLEARNNRDYRVPLASALDTANTKIATVNVAGAGAWNNPWNTAVDGSVNGLSGLYCLDFLADNPARDQVLLEGVTNLRLRTQYVSAPTGGSLVRFCQETLFA